VKPDVIVVFAFGKFKKCLEFPNWSMAVRATDIAENLKVPIFTQGDMPVLPTGTTAEIYFAEKCEETGRLSTLEIIQRLKELADGKSWNKVYVVAASPHIKRCVRDLKKFGFEVVKEYPHSSLSYNANSFYWWTRSPFLWWLREIPLRLLPWRLYKKIAS